MSMEILLVIIGILVLMFFVVVAMAVGSIINKPKNNDLVARVEKLRKAPPAVAFQQASTGKAQAKEKKSLLSAIDLKPLLSKFSGDAFFENLEKDLTQADIKLKPSEFIVFRAIMIVWGMVMVYALTWYVGYPSLVIALLSFFIFIFIHKPILAFLKSARIAKFSNQLGDFLVLITNSLRAGQTFMQGCSVAAAESPDPIASEFKQVIKEVNLGMPEDEAMENLLLRVPSEDLKIVVSGYTIQRRVGGNLAEILDQTAATIRERIKIQGQINTLTTQGKLSGCIVALIPFFVGAGISFVNPDYMAPMTHTGWGWCLMGFAIFMQGLGAFAIWKIVSIEI